MDIIDRRDRSSYRVNTLGDGKSGYQTSRDNSATISNYEETGRGMGRVMRKDATEPDLR
jgi:hypothetical protein